ncbi:MAG: hypothetical protein EU544_00670 [Promethearchaeota archaeon]|nr:MAG: hypothetical protein EU544_00670 [Candidatus Lokiarchaeota archaeon]
MLDLVGLEGTNLTTAKDFGIELSSASTACWRGYVMRYEIIEKELLIEGFLVNTNSNEEMPEILGIKPTRDHELNRIFKYEYRNLNLKVPFNGSLLLAKDFIDSEYVHMGYQSPTAYKTVLKFDFKDGIIVNVEDKSNQIEKAREKGDPKGHLPRSMNSEDLTEWIMDRFSLKILSSESQKKAMEEVEEEKLKELEKLKKGKE